MAAAWDAATPATTPATSTIDASSAAAADRQAGSTTPFLARTYPGFAAGAGGGGGRGSIGGGGRGRGAGAAVLLPDRAPGQPEWGTAAPTAAGIASPSASPSPAATDGGPPGPDTPSSATDAAAAARKRPRTARGARGVANLTPEQLARKRANDREAQRAIRERQRQRMEQYEREIAELKAQQPYQELQGVLRQKEAVEAELADVKRCLAAIVAMIQPVLGGPAAGAVPAGSPSPGQSHHPPARPLTAPSTDNSASTPTSVTSPVSVSAGPHGHWQSSSPSPAVLPGSIDGPPQQAPELAILRQQRYHLAHGLDLGSERLALGFLVDSSTKIPRIKTGVDGAQDSGQYRHVPMKHDWTAAVSAMPAGMQPPPPAHPPAHPPIYAQPAPLPGVIPTSAPFPLPAHATCAASPSAPSSSTVAVADPPIYTLTPRNCPPTCPLDSILLDFLAERRQRFAEGHSAAEILGPRYPSVSSLLNPAVSVHAHPLSKVFTDILARFPHLSTLPERTAVLYLMFLLMRWMVLPTQANYDRLPPWYRPLRVQIDHPSDSSPGPSDPGPGLGAHAARGHPAWYDYLPFPRMRERLVRAYAGPADFPFDDFFIPFTSTLSVNWPYDDALVLLASPVDDELMINPVFEQHLGVLANWSLGEAFHRAFPDLAGCYNLKKGS